MPEAFRYFSLAIAVATIAGALCALVGTFVVQRGMSYIGHGLSHAIFGWAVLSFVTNINFYLGAGIGGFASALMINGVTRRRVISADAAIGVITTATFAVGVALISKYRTFTRNLEASLFGDVLGAGKLDLLVLSLVGIAITIVIIGTYRPLLFTSFDREVAQVAGVRTGAADMLLSLVLAATVVTTMRVLGVTLIAAALVIPPATARLVTHRFGRLILISTALGAVSGFLGFLISYQIDIASGASVVLCSAAFFGVVFLATAIRDRRRVRVTASQ